MTIVLIVVYASDRLWAFDGAFTVSLPTLAGAVFVSGVRRSYAVADDGVAGSFGAGTPGTGGSLFA